MDRTAQSDSGRGERVTLPCGIVIRPFEPGEASYISYLHMKLYREVYGFHAIFEHYVMRSMVEFVKNRAGGELWIALDGEKIIGGIAIVPTEEKQTAQLRWFIIDEGYQGKGVGRALMEIAMRFVESEGYRKVILWTASKLYAARHLYESWGFVKTQEHPNTEWADEEIFEERWDKTLG